FRGAGDAGNYPTRNTFLNYSVQDSFNVERFDFSYGPNSTFFGDGQIGGLASRLNLLYQKNNNSTTSQWRDGAKSQEKAADLAVAYKFTPATEIAVDFE